VLRVASASVRNVGRVLSEQPDTDVAGHLTVIGGLNGNGDAKLRATLLDDHRGVGPRGALP